jgi:hypothetical protein
MLMYEKLALFDPQLNSEHYRLDDGLVVLQFN